MIDQVLFKSNIAGEQVGGKVLGEFCVRVQAAHHGFLSDEMDNGLFRGGGCGHAHLLPGKATLTEEHVRDHKSQHRFLPLFGNYG